MRIKELIAKLKSFRLSKKILLVSAKCFNLVVSNPSQSSPSFCVDQFVASTFPPALPPPPCPGTPQAFEPFEDEFFQIATHTQGQNCVQMFRATAGFHGLFFLTRGRINNRDFLVNLFF